MILLNDFFSAIRPLNILFVGLALWSFGSESLLSRTNLEYGVICFFTCFIMIWGNIENDILDYKLDTECKGKRNVFVQRIMMWPYRWVPDVLLIVIISIIPFGLDLKVYFLSAIILLKFYNYYLKKLPLVGNCIIALLCALILYPFGWSATIVSYAIVIFLLTLLREIVKDKEDERCDRLFGYQTLPIVLSESQLKLCLIILGAVSMIFQYHFIHNAILFCVAFFIGLVYSVFIGKWSLASKSIKLWILTGILTIKIQLL